MGLDPARNPIRQLLAAANLANCRDPAAIPELCELLRADDGAVRRWGVLGLLALGDKAASAADSLLASLKDSSPDVRLTAAEALCGLGQVEAATPVLITLLSHEGVWSYDNIPDMISLVRSCVDENEPANLKTTRRRCLP